MNAHTTQSIKHVPTPKHLHPLHLPHQSRISAECQLPSPFVDLDTFVSLAAASIFDKTNAFSAAMSLSDTSRKVLRTGVANSYTTSSRIGAYEWQASMFHISVRQTVLTVHVLKLKQKLSIQVD